MRNLILVLVALFAVVTFIRAYDSPRSGDGSPTELAEPAAAPAD